MKIAFDRLDLTNFRPLFTAYVRPHLEYCAQAVGLYTEQDIKSLERVQGCATKLVKQIRNMTYEERLTKLGLPSIRYRLCRGDLIETYKLLTGKVNVEALQFFELENQERTRRHRLILKKKGQSMYYGSSFSLEDWLVHGIVCLEKVWKPELPTLSKTSLTDTGPQILTNPESWCEPWIDLSNTSSQT